MLDLEAEEVEDEEDSDDSDEDSDEDEIEVRPLLVLTAFISHELKSRSSIVSGSMKRVRLRGA